MERFFCEIKKICTVILIVLLITIVMAPTAKAAYTDPLKVGETYEYDGILIITYKSKDGANKSNLLKINGILINGDKIKIEEKDGNILKIGNSKYIKLDFLNTATKFKQLSNLQEKPIIEPQLPEAPIEQPNDQIINVNSIELNITSGNLYYEKGGEYTLKPTIYPQNATNKNIIWSTDNPQVVTVDQNGKIKWQSIGTATITATTEDGNKVAKCKINATKLEINKTTLTLNVGETSNLQVKYAQTNTKKSVTWSSSNEKIAKVDSTGNVKGIKAGTATITGKATNGIELKCKVTVKNVSVKSIKINKSELKITVGKSATLTEEINPSNATNKNVTWKSSNTKVATVDENGKVTGNKAGTATITVKTEDGSKTAKCIVTVIKAVTGVKLNKTSLNMSVNEKLALKPTISPNDATNQEVTWSSNNTKVATVSSKGEVTAKSIGTAIITVKTKDGGKTHSCTVKVDDPYKYEFNNNIYTIAIKKDKLNSVLNTISKYNIAQKYGGRNQCAKIANSHIYMLLGLVNQDLVRHDGNGYTEKHPYYGSYSSYFNNSGREIKSSSNTIYSNIKSYLDAKKPLRLHVYSGTSAHWVTVVGYKGNCNKLSDLLILSCWHGYLIEGGTGDALSLWGDYNFRIHN